MRIVGHTLGQVRRDLAQMGYGSADVNEVITRAVRRGMTADVTLADGQALLSPEGRQYVAQELERGRTYDLS